VSTPPDPPLILSGTSAAGKSALTRHLCIDLPETGSRQFGLVQAVTTRPPREDDEVGTYEYVDAAKFQEYESQGELLTNVSYRNSQSRYGITRAAYQTVRQSGRVPVLTLAPESAIKFSSREAQPSWRCPLTVFLDAPDSELDRRLAARGTGAPREDAKQDAHKQRDEDRAFRYEFLYIIEAGTVAERATLLRELYELNTWGRTGILHQRLIDAMVRCHLLLEESITRQVSGASYDLRLGDEYFYGGRIRRLSDEDPILVIEPYDYAITTSRERANLPRDVAARFDLAVSLFAQGMILSNGPQIDPGFRGPLFCLLFNTSSSPVLLKRGQHYATLEFHRLLEPTAGYKGQYQQKTLLDYLPANAARGAINELKKEIEALRAESQKLQTSTWAILSFILALIALYVSVK